MVLNYRVLYKSIEWWSTLEPDKGACQVHNFFRRSNELILITHVQVYTLMKCSRGTFIGVNVCHLGGCDESRYRYS